MRRNKGKPCGAPTVDARGRCVIAVAGNPNVGKSTLFNALTGMKQHTGNWPGKTVSNARGRFRTKRHEFILLDIPGCYSLAAHSAEEAVARDCICFEESDLTLIVCDATCLERNLNLTLQILETARRAIVCINLVDEAKRKGIAIDCRRLSKQLGVPVVPVIARRKRTLARLLDALDDAADGPDMRPRRLVYPAYIEEAAAHIAPMVRRRLGERLSPRWVSLKILEGDADLLNRIAQQTGIDLAEDTEILRAMREAQQKSGASQEEIRDEMARTAVRTAEQIAGQAVIRRGSGYGDRERRVDAVLTGRFWGWISMAMLLAAVFWLTISGANLVSDRLGAVLMQGQEWLSILFERLGAPIWIHDALVLGVYRVLAWVVSVMLPPMAIFFPLFTLLEDAGYLPRIAFNLDCPFRKCCACGKQALTMCMGFGCNAVGVTGCRIIDSPRERLIAILTNSFVPCNGRFPTLIALITLFFVQSGSGVLASAHAALLLTAAVLLGIGMTFAASKLLSATVLRGEPSSFTLELPPYRRPQVGSVIVRSVLDRTLFVLGRAAAVAAPAGLIIWLAANLSVGGNTVLNHLSAVLDPVGRWMGLDGVLLMAFILGFPANEIVMPIALMAYMAQGTLPELGDAARMKQVLTANGWSQTTALCTMIFMLFHWPCSTTLLTIRKETGSARWTALAFALPTAAGVLLCVLVNALSSRLCG